MSPTRRLNPAKEEQEGEGSLCVCVCVFEEGVVEDGGAAPCPSSLLVASSCVCVCVCVRVRA